MEKIIFATHNKGKIIEMRAILSGLPIEIIDAEEAGVKEEPVEDGETFEANALIKAGYVATLTGEWSAADDSGICIDALGGKPGVHSARWAGEGVDLAEFTLSALEGVPEARRTGCFVSSAVLVSPTGEHWTFTGEIKGRIADALAGEAHPKLPYDRIFIPEGYDVTFAEMSMEEKNGLSHRGRAFRELREWLEAYLRKNS
ncbi:RdgB/HAM1 family non-canonical purine NTP pyrophosphatase [Candidatus Falkowbacteria bacterium]|nr:RdgB/HAM1 family non-canonical purine NTP pyrophosphatase [Candidatus Falkowbacteria bacterium]